MSYDPARATRVYVDHGPEGVASTIAQRYDVPGQREPEWRAVAHHSRSLKKAEKGYSKGEGESLALLCGIKTHDDTCTVASLKPSRITFRFWFSTTP